MNPLPQNRPAVRAAIYARYSSEMQSSTSAQDQVNRILDLVKKGQLPTRLFPGSPIRVLPDWIYQDEAITGKVAGRFGYQTILQGIRKRAFDILIVDDLSRLTRSLGNLLDLYQLLRHFDIELISISDRISSADPNAKVFFSVKGMVADFGNDIHAERTRRGLEARARENFATGVKPYGYGSRPTRIEKRKGKEVPSHFEIFIIQEQADVVRRIFELYARGHGKVYIAKTLNQEKIPLKTVSSKSWKTGPIDRILHNEKYIGRWVFNRTTHSFDPETHKQVTKLRPRTEWIINEKEDLRIVPQELWDKVQARFKENLECRRSYPSSSHKGIFGKRDRIDNLHLLSGVVACPDCRGSVVIVSGRADGYYGCLDAQKHGTCKNRTLVPRKKMEKAVLDYLNQDLVSNPKVIGYVTKKYNALVQDYLRHAPNRRKELELELKKVSSEIENIVRFITEGRASDIEVLSETLRQRESRKSKITEEMSHLAPTDDRKLLVTPYLVQKRLAALVTTLADRGDRYNAMMREIFQGPLVLSKKENQLFLEGTLNLSKALSSTQCTSVLTNGSTPR